MQKETSITPSPLSRQTWQLGLLVVVSVFIFLFAIDLMVTSLKALGEPTIATFIDATANPFTGLFAGLLVTAIIQSSSTTTSLAVTLVASGSLPIASAIPIIMGANIGTTITSTIVSLGFLAKKKEFRRAVAAGTYHCFFNVLTASVLFPLEYNYGFLSKLSVQLAGLFSTNESAANTESWSLFGGVSEWILHWAGNVVPAVIAFILLFSSILYFRKIISELLEARSPEAFSKFFFGGEFRSFSWGFVTTAAIRSSTITTSVVVPVVAKKIVDLKRAAPFILGANVGTTVTAFIAALLSSDNSAMSIAIAHFLFNVLGVLIFFPIPALRQVPIKLAKGLGLITYENRILGFVFIVLTFFIIPFALIFLSR